MVRCSPFRSARSESQVLPFSISVYNLPDKQLHAHYFVGGCDWYVAELDPETGDAFGYADLGHGEWGYFNLVEMERTVASGWLVVERELDFRLTTPREVGIA
jgi:hypothetical protein